MMKWMTSGTLLLAMMAIGCKKSGNDGSAVVAKIQAFEQAMCACSDEACATKVRSDLDAFEKTGAIAKPTDQQMSAVVKSQDAIAQCEHKYILDDPGKQQLDALRKGLADARAQAAAGHLTEATFACSVSDLDRFAHTYSAFAARPDIAPLVTEYRTYCTTGMYLESATKDVEKAETDHAASPHARPETCASPAMAMAGVKLAKDADAMQKLSDLKDRLAKACGS